MLVTWRFKFKMDDHVYLKKTKAKMANKKRKIVHRRKWLTLEEKLKIIEFHDNGKRSSRIAQELGMNESSVRSILRKKDFYKSLGNTKSLYGFKSFARCRSYILDKMEEQLTAWIEEHNRKRIQLTENDIQKKALELFEELRPEGECGEKFSASRGWFYRFKSRINLKNCVINGGNLPPDKALIEAFQREFTKLVEDGNYSLHQIFNAEEMSLYWKKIPCQSFLKEVETNIQGYRPSKDPLTVSLCGNVAGDFKLKPLVVYRSETPFALRDFDKDLLPVVWRSNKGAWLSKELFEDWYINCFCPTVEAYCYTRGLEFKILLVLDSSRNHDALPLHENITIVYLPDDTTTSLLQPMTCSLFPSFKTNYLRKILLQALSTPDTPLVEFWSGYNIKHAIDHVDSCWCEVTPEEITASWHRILPEVKVKDFDSQLRAIVKDVLSMGRCLGLDNLDLESIHGCTNLWECESPVVDFEEVLCKEETPLSEEQNVDSELKEIIQCIDTACETIAKWDSNIERSIKVRQILQNGIQQYRELFDLRTKEKP